MLFIPSFFFPVPSAGPSFVTITGVTPSTLSIKWGAIPCIHQNGIITGYSVKYWNSRDGKVTVFRADATEATISGLNMSTAYRIQVAAENRAGVGVYSEPAIEKSTLPGKILCYMHTPHCPRGGVYIHS